MRRSLNPVTLRTDTMKRLYDIYRSLEQGTTPTAEFVGTGNVIGRAVTPSHRGDVIVAEHVEGDIYDVVLVESEEESRSQQMQRAIQNPLSQTSTGAKQMTGCRYQFQRTELPELAASDTTVSPRILHDGCEWRRNIETHGRAHSADQLQRAWERWRARDAE